MTPEGIGKRAIVLGLVSEKMAIMMLSAPRQAKRIMYHKASIGFMLVETMKRLIADNRIWFGHDGNSFPAVKQFISEVGGRKSIKFTFI